MAERAGAGSSAGPSAAASLLDLSDEQRRILAYASALGSEFDFELLRASMGADEEALAEEVERLVHRGILRERAGGGRFGFDEEEVRGQIYRSLTESRLRVLHRKIGTVLEEMYPDPPPEVLSELGRHYFLGKAPEKSSRYNRRAAEIAREGDEPEVAIHHLERVLVDLAALGESRRRERAEVAEALGDLSYATGNFRAADRYFTEALEHADTADPKVHARLLLARAEVARENLNVDAAVTGAAQALRYFNQVDDRVGIAQTYRLLGRVAFQRGLYREALDESMRALETLPARADPRLRGRLAIDIGNAFSSLGSQVRPEAIEWYERAIERLREAGDWGELARAYHNLGVSVGEVRPQDGLDYLAEARTAAERAHDARATGRSLLSGVEMRLAIGDLEEAERDNEQAGRLLERLGDRLGMQQVVVNRGLIAEKRGQWDDAERAYTEGLAVARRYQLLGDEAEAQFHLARLCYKTRNLDGARAALRAARELKIGELRPHLLPAYEELVRQVAEPVPPAAGAATSDEHPL